jgi:hypothetical protein
VERLCLEKYNNGIQRFIPNSWKIWRGIKFGGLADQPAANRQIKIRQY